ncbi:hypothetical protein CLHOM_35290 [Clostridium homopropionicum DSM 5847]|uniref:Uncharacterized protein n=1 Tax=Clostridium homopropionicum DSM 5847 TaxID=1121318 RepID=A0A0L6Z5G1_9CLOT|nr:hypothetical protein [Clostridium homopropionicum]KOA18078.1 hypothetical protein CLHOM_35290 [Clostridium homopropionicum DSM 5847]SFG71282.1 hypothetical protein SAMN04488501_11411 [Clostridium homopropionicum]
MEVLNVLSSWAIGELFTVAKGVVLDMLDTFIKHALIVYVIKLVLKHNLFIHSLKIKIKLLGFEIEVRIKEKSAPSSQD